MRRFTEFLKNLVILLLLGCLILLAAASVPTETIRSSPWLSGLLQPVAPLLGLPQAELTYVEAALPVLDAAQPVMISVRNSLGRTTAQWDFQALDDTFDDLGGTLGQALDTAGEFSEVTQKELENALSGVSVYFSYGVTLPADLLASWLDASVTADAPDANACVLSLEADLVRLYLVGDRICAAATGVQPNVFSHMLELYKPDGSQFAFEAGLALSPLSLLPSDSSKLYGADISSPADSRYTEQLATNFGFNPYDDTGFTDAAGITYFSEANCALQLSEDGRLSLTSTAADRFQASGSSPEALVEEARRLVELAAGAVIGDARLYLTAIRQEGERTVCTFDYFYAGIPVELGSGHAATVAFLGSSMIQMDLQLLSFTTTVPQLYLLPAAQAAAIIPDGASLTARYYAANAALTVEWALEP